jgi:lipopolysaccharide export system permease protein
MTIFDRYLLKLYAKVLVVSFVSLAGLFVVIDGMGNLDEFVTYGHHRIPDTAKVMAEYYGPRMLQFFDQIAGLLAMLAAAFVLTLLARSNEMTALLAAGVAPSRILQPLVAASIFVALLGAANREFGLPQVRDSLSRNAQDWLGDTGRKCTPHYDIRSDILIAGKSTYANQKRLAAPLFDLPRELAPWGRQIAAENAYYVTATAQRPAGYVLSGVKQPANLGQLASQSLPNGERVLFSPSDTPWLKPDECFVASVVTFEQLSVGGSWRQRLSTYELVTGLRGQTIEPGADVWVTLHARFVQPLLDLSLVLMGIPLVLSRATRNIFVAAGIGAGLVAGLLIVVLACHTLGRSYLLSATLAAWLPLLVFGPLAYTLARPLWD